MAEAIAWLVEKPSKDGAPTVWRHPRLGWTTAMNMALRFSRKVDAEAYIKSVGFVGVVAREHEFLDAVPRLYSVARWADGDRVVIVRFSDKLSDDQVRSLHEYLRGWSPDKETGGAK